MLKHFMIAALVAAGLSACVPRTSSNGANELAAEYERQLHQAGNQLARIEVQSDLTDEQQARFDAQLKKWEEQSARYDALLDRWERERKQP
ncbi:hypothetical protein [Lysobacter panacisoli]|uniref:Lipoprotein n=1 Tax=Lysobacter panacisoli TaxID=1255263 RepID=A0ABP9LNB3_9GAMM|nr:hypothetical protein [Lysobacter panacisoli]